MSKLDALRAMREARYAEDQARAAGRPAKTSQTSRTSTTRPPVAPPVTRDAARRVPTPVAEAGTEACGHRNMGGRTCTREQGHSAKSHRYS